MFLIPPILEKQADPSSVTPLKANFWHVPNIKGEIKL